MADNSKKTGRMARPAKKKVRHTVIVGIDEDLAAELQDAEQRLRRQDASVQVRGAEATDADRSLLDRLQKQVDDLKRKVRESGTAFVFEAIGRKEYDKLIKEHPPTEAQMAVAKEENVDLPFNPDTFPFELIDRSCVEPEFEPGELAAWLREDPDNEWNMAEVGDLMQAATYVNMQRPRANLGKGLPQIPYLGQS